MLLVPPQDVTLDPGGSIDLSGPRPEVASSRWQWTDTNGRVWDLTDWSSPLIKLKGATGLGIATFEHSWTDNPLVDGSSWEGGRFTRNEVFLPLMVRGEDSKAMQANLQAFLAGLNPKGLGTLRITRPDTTWREIRLRYSSGADFSLDLDPIKARRARYGITWEAEQPLWLGEPVVTTFGLEATPGDFFPGPPFYISPVSVLGRAIVRNPGNEDVSPLWHIGAPFTGFSVGVGSSLVSMTLTKTSGYVEVDTSPRAKTILDENGVDLWPQATTIEMAQIPAGAEVVVVASAPGATAASNIQVSFSPRYWSAMS